MLSRQPRFTIILWTLMFATPALQAQPYYFRHYQVENGLSNNTVYCSIQDSTGFMWFGTKEGLNRFDGYNFKLFKFHSEENDWAERELIYCLFNDPLGNLWVGTQKGLFVFDRQTEQLQRRFPSLPDINGIQTDAKGNLWFLSGTTPYRYDQQRKVLKKFSSADYFSATAICLTSSGQLWFATTDGRLARYSEVNDQFTFFDLYSHSPGVTSCLTEKIASADSNHIYVGTTCQGIKEFNIKTGKYRDILIYNADKTPVYVRDILKYSDNEYWFATESGIFVHNRVTNTFTNIRKKFLDPYSLSDNAVYTLSKDIEGGVWAGTYFGGINHYAKQFAAFRKYFADNSSNAIKGSAIREIRKDDNGNIWIGTEDAGINRLDPRTGKITNFSPDGSGSAISYSNIHGMLLSGNELWLGTHEHGVDIIDIRTGKLIKHYNEGTGKGDLKNNFVLSFLETRDKQIYLGTANSIQLFDRKTGSFQACRNAPVNCVVSSIIEAKDGTIWAGTHGQGVYYFHPKTGKHGNLSHSAGDSNGLTANTINAVVEDSQGNIWIATEGGGAVKVNGEKKIVRRLSTKDGLTSNFIFHIVEDKDANIWLTTSKGLNKLNPSLTNIKVFTRSSGLLNDQFNYHSGFCDSDGTLYFGSVRGMISFRPDQCSSPVIVPKVFITGLQVNNKELAVQTDSGVMLSAITHTSQVVLSYDQSSLSLDFAALSYISPELTTYRYILEGVDRNWTELSVNRKVYFTDLSPGKYIFRVKASNNGQWIGKEARLEIIIRPPIWASGWAYLLYALAIATITFVVIRFYYRRAKDRKEKEIYAAKIEFFTNVAHEIRTPLTLIKGPVENLTEKITTYPDISADVHTLGRNTDRLIRLVSGVLDFRKTEASSYSLNFSKVNFNEIVEENFLDFEPMAVKRKLHYELHAHEQSCLVWADEDALNKIISNLLSNAVKYADTYVAVKLESGPDKIILSVSSDGYKIPDAIREKIFEPFFRMKETSKQKGAGIGLALARSLAELHNGKLFLVTNDETRNVFVFELPFTTGTRKLKSNHNTARLT